MLKQALTAAILVGIISASGCINGGFLSGGDPAYGNNPGLQVSGGSGSESCGGLYEPCCEFFGRDEFGQFTARYYCNEGTCVDAYCDEGPDYQAYDRGPD